MVNSAAKGIHTLPTTTARCSVQPDHHPCYQDLLRQQGTNLACHGMVLCQKTEQGIGRIKPPNNHDDERFDKKLVGIELLPPALAFDGGRRRGYLLDEPE